MVSHRLAVYCIGRSVSLVLIRCTCRNWIQKKCSVTGSNSCITFKFGLLHRFNYSSSISGDLIIHFLFMAIVFVSCDHQYFDVSLCFNWSFPQLNHRMPINFFIKMIFYYSLNTWIICSLSLYDRLLSMVVVVDNKKNFKTKALSQSHWTTPRNIHEKFIQL